MNKSDIIGYARATLHDTVSPYRWSDLEFNKYLKFCFLWMRSNRPEHFLDESLSNLIDVIESRATAIDEIVSMLPTKLGDSIAHYLVYRCLSEDDTDAVNMSRADRYYTLFLQGV